MSICRLCVSYLYLVPLRISTALLVYVAILTQLGNSKIQELFRWNSEARKKMMKTIIYIHPPWKMQLRIMRRQLQISKIAKAVQVIKFMSQWNFLMTRRSQVQVRIMKKIDELKKTKSNCSCSIRRVLQISLNNCDDHLAIKHYVEGQFELGALLFMTFWQVSSN